MCNTVNLGKFVVKQGESATGVTYCGLKLEGNELTKLNVVIARIAGDLFSEVGERSKEAPQITFTVTSTGISTNVGDLSPDNKKSLLSALKADFFAKLRLQ